MGGIVQRLVQLGHGQSECGLAIGGSALYHALNGQLGGILIAREHFVEALAAQDQLGGHLTVLHGQLTAVDLEHGLPALHLNAVGAVRQNLGLLLVVGILRVGLADNADVLQIYSGFGMVRQQIADGLDLAQAVDLALDYLQSGASENRVPGLRIVLVSHIVVGMVAGNDHHGTEDDFLIAGLLHHLHHILRQRRGLHGAYEMVDVSGILEYLLHPGVDAVGIGGGAVAHPAHGGLAVLDGILGSVRHGLGCLGKVVFAGQQGRTDLNGLELTGVLLLQQIAEVAVFIAVHQVSGLDQQILYAALYGAVQSLLHVIDLLAVPAVDMLDDDIGSEAAADVIVGESLLQVVLNGLDGGYPVVVEAGAEADNQQFVLPGAVLAAGVVLGGVSGGVIVQIPAQDNGHLGTGRGAIGNSSNVMELGSLNETKTDSNLGVDAILWIGGVGSVGTKAIGDLLTGKVTPSGRTCDIWPADLTADPTWNNFGTYQYSNVDASNSTDGHAFSVEYEEGIYIGYRYYETAAAEAQAGNYASYDYDDAVIYPFGYGLSYTTFEMSYASEPTLTDGRFQFGVNVTNTGSAPGKQVVQIYAEAPYTYGGIEKSKVVLVGFGKTGLLQPGESQVVSISAALDDLASYDYQNAKSYVLDAGSYRFYLSENSHSWASIDPSDSGKCYEYTQQSTITYNSDGSKRASDEIVAVNQFDDITNYHFVAYTDNRAGNGYAHNMTRADFAASFPTAPTDADLVADEKVLAGINYKVADDEKGDGSLLPTTGADNGLVLADLRGVDYDDPMWDDLLDQLTVGDMHDLCAYGHFETAELASVAAPYTADIDSPNGLINFFQPDLKSNGYPTEPVLASTWNVELARERGECIGEDVSSKEQKNIGFFNLFQLLLIHHLIFIW